MEHTTDTRRFRQQAGIAGKGIAAAAFAVVLTAASTMHRTVEIDATAYGFPFRWLTRFPEGTTNLDKPFYFWDWRPLLANFAIYLMLSVVVVFLFGSRGRSRGYRTVP